MKLLRIIPLALVLAAGPSYADPPAGGGSGAAVSDADTKRWLVFWDKLVDTVVADKDTCPKMGTDVNALIDANKDLLATAQRAKAAGRKLPPDAAQHMKDTVPKLGGAMMGCVKDPGVKTALRRLNVGNSSGDPHAH